MSKIPLKKVFESSGYSLVVLGLLIGVASLVAEHSSRGMGLSSCGIGPHQSRLMGSTAQVQ